MRLRAALVICLGLVTASCATTTARGKQDLKPGMTIEQVRALLGKPDERSFRDKDEALQYYDIVGLGQCEYITAWFRNDSLLAVTSRRGTSVGGCGLGSDSVDWGQMPKPAMDVNLNIRNN